MAITALTTISGTIDSQPFNDNFSYVAQEFNTHLAENVSVKNYGAVGDGITDDIAALDAAQAALIALGGGLLILPIGVYRITRTFYIENGIQALGFGFSTSPIVRGATTILKDGNFEGIAIRGAYAGIENLTVDGETGNADLGIRLIGARSFMKKITVMNQGGNGIEIGDVIGTSVNLWKLADIITLKNGGDGVYINSNVHPTLPNANAGYLLGLDARGNTGDGLHIRNAVDNTFINIACQGNTGIGIHLSEGAEGNYFPLPYTENNTGGQQILDVGADRNFIIGYRSGTGSDEIIDNGIGNYILGRHGQVPNQPPFVKSLIVFKEMMVKDGTLSGHWHFRQSSADRSLEMALAGTSASPVVAKFVHDGAGRIKVLVPELMIGADTDNPVINHFHARVALDHPSIPAHTTSDVSASVPGATVKDIVTATPDTIQSGLTWNAFVYANNLVKIRIANITTNTIDPPNLIWNIDVWQRIT